MGEPPEHDAGIRCPACDRANRRGARFCLACGGPLPVACAACGADLPVGARFCDACGRSVVPEAMPPGDAATSVDAERRQLTVMFCDLVGSTALSERLDPEDLRRIVRDYQDTCATVIQRYDGFLAKYLGDGLLVHFGYPVAHEDDPERAVRAGLDIVAAMRARTAERGDADGLRLAVRVGIHTGLVVAGEMGAAGRPEPRAIVGETPNLAARLQEIAAPDSVVVSDATLRLVTGPFVTEDLGTPALKGVAHSTRVHRVVAAVRRDGRALDGAPRPPLVGRERELDLLVDVWERALEGQGQAVLLSGEAGIGKSRLARALRERIGDAPHTWLECCGSPYARNSALQPVIDLLRRALDFDGAADGEERLARLAAEVERIGLAAPTAVPLLATLLSLPVPAGQGTPLSPEARRRDTLEVLIAWILALGERGPVVLLVEDLHWCDPSTLDLLGLVVEQIAAARVLLVLTYRPSFDPPWPPHSHVTPLVLGGLRRRHLEGVVAGVTAGRAMPPAVVDRIVERSGGIPLHAEELTKMVLDAGLVREVGGRYERTDPLPELAVPSTLQGSLMARLDRLGAAKEVAQLASVIGREFPHVLLEAVTGLSPGPLAEAIGKLVAADLLQRRGIAPRATYGFRHALIQDTAYHSLLRSRRQRAHATVAASLEERFPDVVEAQPEVLAHHYDGAGMPERAIACHRRAAAHATERSAYAEAVAHLTRALDLLPGLPDAAQRDREELALQIALGPPLIARKGYGDPDVERTYARARELCRENDRPAERFDALWGLANYHQSRSDLDVALDLATQLVEIAESTHDSDRAVWAHLQLGATLFWRGEPARSLEHLERSIALFDPADYRLLPGAPDPGVAARGYAGVVLWQLGHFDRALATSDDAVALGRTKAHPFSLALALCFAGIVRELARDLETVHAYAEEVVRLATAQEFPLWRGLGRMLRGWVRALVTHEAAALADLQQGLHEIASIGTEVGAPGGLFLLAEAQHAVGRDADALATVGLGIAIADEKRQHSWDVDLYRLRDELLTPGRTGAPGTDASVRDVVAPAEPT